MQFTPAQVVELSQIIDRYTRHFIGVHIGRDFLSDAEIKNLKSLGLELPPVNAPTYLEAAFRFGLLSVALGNEAAKGLNYAQFKAYLERGNFMSLTTLEQRALSHLKTRAYTDIKGLGNRVSNDIINATVQQSRQQAAQYRKLIQNAAEQAVTERQSVRTLVSNLGNQSQDWARDFHRIADYLMHEAFDTARAMAILKAAGPAAEVFKDVYDQACPTCQKLYLTAGLGSEPKVYPLTTLLENGSNIGRKSADMLAVIGPTHPYCRCTLNQKPAGSVWDSAKKQFVLQRKTDQLTDRVRNRKSRGTVTITE